MRQGTAVFYVFAITGLSLLGFLALMFGVLVYAVIEIKSDTSLAEAVQLLSQHKILSAPVVDVDAPEDASWIDRYIGMVEFAGIVVWIVHQVSMPTNLHE